MKATTIHPKVKTAAYASGAALPVSQVVLWIAETSGLDMPVYVAGAFAWIITALASFVAGYLRSS